MTGLAVYRLALRLLALGVSGHERSEWVAEWTSELWYVGAEAMRGGSFVQRHLMLLGFCRGAIVDRRALREQGGVPPVRAARTAVGCCASLAVAAVVLAALAHLLPGVRRAMRPVNRKAASSVMIRYPDQATVALGAVRAIERRPHRLFAEFGYYEAIKRPLHLAPGRSPLLRVARSSRTLLGVVGAPIWFLQEPANPREPLLILSEAVWRTQFASRADVFGTEVKLGLQRVRLAGVAPSDDATDGLGLDAWLLMPDEVANTLDDATQVFFVGRIAPDADLPMKREGWQMYVTGPGGEQDYNCTSLAATRLEPMGLFLFALMLALLSLPATTTLSLGDYPRTAASAGLTRTTVRRWVFLVGKIALVLPVIYFGTLDAVYAGVWRSASMPEYVQLVVSFAACLFALRWALRDQRKRCPVCLGTLRCPARVGQPSRNFLAWNGTELICVAGHGLLHVPELPTSWCRTQRWLYLDASWSKLFLVPG